MRLAYPLTLAVLMLAASPAAPAQQPFQCLLAPFANTVPSPIIEVPWPAGFLSASAGDIERSRQETWEAQLAQRHPRLAELMGRHATALLHPGARGGAVPCATDIRTRIFDGTTWLDQSRTQARYDAAGRLTTITTEFDLDGSGTLQLTGRTDYEYNASGWVQLATFWGNREGVVSPFLRVAYAYDVANRVTEVLVEDTTDTGWLLTARDTPVYGSGTYADQIRTERLENGQMVENFRTFYTYFAHATEGDLLTEIASERLEGGTWTLTHRTTNAYTPQGWLNLQAHEGFQGGVLEPYYRVRAAYGARSVPDTVASDSWDGDWGPLDERVLGYSPEGYLNEHITSFDTGQGELTLGLRDSLNYANGRVVLATKDNHLTGEWIRDSRTTYEYDELGRLVRRFVEIQLPPSHVEAGGGDWTPWAETVYAYDGSVGTEDDPVGAARAVSVFPNPAALTARIALPGTAQALVVYDALGRVVERRTLGARLPETLTLDTSGWPAGVYLVRVTLPEGAAAQRLTVLR